MIIDSHYSLPWVLLALFLLLVLGGCIGMIQMRLKRIDSANTPSGQLKKDYSFIYRFSWGTVCFIIAALIIMTNPTIFP
jgi:hypothetical protein